MSTSGSVVVGGGEVFSSYLKTSHGGHETESTVLYFSGGISSHDRATLLCPPPRCVWRVLPQFVNNSAHGKRSRPVESRRQEKTGRSSILVSRLIYGYHLNTSYVHDVVGCMSVHFYSIATSTPTLFWCWLCGFLKWEVCSLYTRIAVVNATDQRTALV
jgi:hypothetical protein